MKTILLSVLLSTLPWLAQGQSVRVGADYGMLFSRANKTAPYAGLDKQASSLNRGTFGLNLEVGLSQHLSVVAEANYETVGFVDRYTISMSSQPQTNAFSRQIKEEYVLKYLGVPLLLRYKMGQRVAVFGELGLNTRFFVDADYTLENVPYAGSPSPDSIYEEGTLYRGDVRFISLSGVAGLGAEYPLGARVAVQVGARYYLGLNEYNKYPLTTVAEEIKINALRVNAGLRYRLK
ncbi:hypothetical protein GCM10027275_39390 [Rhabdobacter roseus]|uniref:Outer membrane protein beta-barrel domain-containing protein n=1 Tax=Rhabdobacter roseus TaxID=1655419 RepID=A0A840TRV3_9BACT|nr:outer membrane beta-barrel protein [Rhabdobacter roseus]MBB5285645.1 hypothetical protein [Rhabdobacter roseus]